MNGLGQETLDLIPLGVIFMDRDERMVLMNRFAADRFPGKLEKGIFLKDILQNVNIDLSDQKRSLQFKLGDEAFVAQRFPFYLEELGDGEVLIFQQAALLEEVIGELDLYKNLNFDLKAIFDISYDVIYVSDGQGITLRVSSACKTLWGYKEEELVGRSVYELEREGVYYPSITRLVLEKKEQVSMIQTTKTGRRLKVVGTPIKDEEGRIIRVVNASRDVTEVSQLQSEIELLRQLTESYRKEIMDLRSKKEFEKEMIYRSEQMEKVVSFSQKVAKVDSSVLLLGESGVGKEVMASYIHKWSHRHEGPFITVHCGAIPPLLLETELFGDERGAEVKPGCMEMAHEGTLFLDEVEQIPPALQVKLLQAIQEKRVTRMGGSTFIEVNVRIISATTQDIEQKVQSGQFRKDLYYQLNVVPIAIPPLRERKEDVIPLIIHFADQLNRKYGLKKKFNPLVLKKMQEYAWPGNVRELQNMTERLFVTTEDDWIHEEHLPDHVNMSAKEQKSIQIHKLMPLKEAVELLEKEMLQLAQKRYHSTTKMAEVLGVNQSTISRKLSRWKEE
ncbi:MULTISPECIES: sigma 54-interacting transcriptional regulator [unclassified Paenibacillus]|uniref:sigma 54-interacting transcriptional regulator n=1 Tax=unclassified Paenibacillus TaxID=185978 RepID=UPI001AE418EC|nr:MULTISPECIES: sigma 54-interacting transcriptional regulator [unclassified Paenibacillus]MBP1153345.1 PAS domain S-box-containing protein [Paenibacillus sp. PvP091]MBP1171272.1 PAS domain S-box-containing protein [Paenibacillus sp. PvR098]MBP2442300.1 PAS domain S-box-containing protein [Paenibacillus sp. PvP052]